MSETPIQLPDIGEFDKVEIIEVLIKAGDRVEAEGPLITLESEKATMEIPSPVGGTIVKVLVKVGDKISQGDVIAVCEADQQAAPSSTGDVAPAKSAAPTAAQAASPTKTPASAAPPRAARRRSADDAPPPTTTPGSVYASPSARKLARSLGVDLTEVQGSAMRQRIVEEDISEYVKQRLTGGGDSKLFEGIEPMPPIDFDQFGKTSTESLSRINQLTALATSRAWLTAPHVTQFDEADIGDLEKLRKELNRQHKDQGVKFTFLSFLIKAVTEVLKKYPRFNSSLSPSKEDLIIKHHYHIGIAVDTPTGLVVPVIRNADQKNLKSIAAELVDISGRARKRRLRPEDLQGGTFTISSLGGVGGTAFTPIINPPQVAILGVARSQVKPHWDGEKFVPVNKLPLCLSYDHRVIDGAAAARFTGALAQVLTETDTFKL